MITSVALISAILTVFAVFVNRNRIKIALFARKACPHCKKRALRNKRETLSKSKNVIVTRCQTSSCNFHHSHLFPLSGLGIYNPVWGVDENLIRDTESNMGNPVYTGDLGGFSDSGGDGGGGD